MLNLIPMNLKKLASVWNPALADFVWKGEITSRGKGVLLQSQLSNQQHLKINDFSCCLKKIGLTA